MKRKVIIVGSALALFVGGFFGMKFIAGSKKDPRKAAEKTITTIFTQKVENKSIPIHIIESGRLVAKNKADIYAEVQGVMKPTRKDFKTGVRFRKGDILVHISSGDAYARLQAQKSQLQNLVTSILPDLRIDYPDAYEKWNKYVSDFDIEKGVAPLPETSSAKEKYFITGKNIYTTYYTTKNLEIIQSKYVIRAPFNGILTDALVNPGTVIRTGQKLGEFIDPSVYEMEIAISHSMIDALNSGQAVRITDPNAPEKSWQGKVTRVNGKVDATTQTVKIYIEVKGENLKEGLYLEAHIDGQNVNNAFEFDRKLLVEGSKIYGVKDGKLYLTPVEILHKTQSTVVVSGLKDGEEIIAKQVPGAYEGMEVKVYSEK
ncbi:efflux RND transporter periplasmic adaptor subunit [Reichenbachiella ulvae]|uniref:HlyD family efflux transporter periplasmic adaptor subunit n=1 Tax=Reichenbachiella ulvae TaxID=2980104 RepID=A0ABT3CPX2_9BACT|nr:HlyD family efflux transporter periplasmic adaptor subunit [Reichenbachiella ulvae]MCV9385598.1 HlyD family efflux transporter periplasmic adaptor subunit [Reichenbachiella ulvae]